MQYSTQNISILSSVYTLHYKSYHLQCTGTKHVAAGLSRFGEQTFRGLEVNTNSE